MQIVVIGSGIGGMGSANLLAKAGHLVTVVEKNTGLGGRAGFFELDGFRFDTGPTWYLMPEVFERYFACLGKKAEDYLTLHKLQPTYRIYFHGQEDEPVDIFSDQRRDLETAEQLETGAAEKLANYLANAAKQYDVMTRHFLYRDHRSVMHMLNRGTLPALRTLPLVGNTNRYVSKRFATEEMQKLLQYNLVFLGGSPYVSPALYSFMSHVDLTTGAYYPEGGMYAVIEALHRIGQEHGVEYRTGSGVSRIITENGRATGVELENGEYIRADVVLSNADMYHTETQLLSSKEQTYPSTYWDSRTLAPSAFMLYLGVEGTYPQLAHHTLYFSKDWRQNFADIFDTPAWPNDPSLYVCAASQTDPALAPDGHETIFVLVPIAAGLPDSPEQRHQYREHVLSLLEERMGISDLHGRIVCERTVGPTDFERQFNSYRGTALGLAHTLTQTAVFRPKNKSRKVMNLYYVGAGTHPGIGLPVCLISAELVSDRILKEQG